MTPPSESGRDRMRSEQLGGSFGERRNFVTSTGVKSARSPVISIIHACSTGAGPWEA